MRIYDQRWSEKMNVEEDIVLVLRRQLAESQARVQELLLINETCMKEKCESSSNNKSMEQLVLQSCLLLKQQNEDSFKKQKNVRKDEKYYQTFGSFFQEAKEAADKLFIKGMSILGPKHILYVLRYVLIFIYIAQVDLL